MSKFRHSYRVFETNLLLGAQYEVILLTLPDGGADRRRSDRISSGQAMGKIRLIVDLGRIDDFPVGKQFEMILQAKESEVTA